MLVSWIIFPLLLITLCLGCGLLLEAATGARIKTVLLAPAGYLVAVVVEGILTSRGETAALATPVTVLMALTGFALVFFEVREGKRDLPSIDRWALWAAAGAFAVYAAPVVLSGHPTFTGYIKLDDTATWMAFVDRVMDHGRNLSGLDPSSYLATLQVNLPQGYPVGAFLPLGLGTQLTGTDVAWLVQPYMATMAALLTLCLYQLAQPLVESRPLRALTAFGAAQSALLFGYSLWGGIKEVAVALAIAALAVFAPGLVDRAAGWRGTLPSVLATTALLTMVGSGGLVWAVPVLGLAAVWIWRLEGVKAVLWRAAPFVLLVALLGIPALFAAGVFSPTQGGLTSAAELGNLIAPLHLAQFAGIWPNGDFRLDPLNQPLTAFLIVLATLGAIVGAVFCWRRRSWEPLIYVIGAGAGSLAVFAYSSPWVGGKALASASPSFLLLALAGAAAFAIRVERVLGGTVLALLLAGVLWSNALGYHDVSLAPYDQLRELEEIGEEFTGEGPTLMTEYQPYGVRHFLRAADAEGASELRSRQISLAAGGELEKGEWGDTDQISLSALQTYRTLVLRHNPGQSRPPHGYALVRAGEFYDVWQRPESAERIVEHLALGGFPAAAAAPSCASLRAMADVAGVGTVAAVERQPAVLASLAEAERPVDWVPTAPGSPDLIPGGAGTLSLTLEIPRTERYDLYLQGSTRNRLELVVDGVEVGSAEEQLNSSQQFLYFGAQKLAAGPHEVNLVLHSQTLGPGSGGPPEPIGPLVLSAAPDQGLPVTTVPASEAEQLCGTSFDWIETMP
jgi:hypothetical protein